MAMAPSPFGDPNDVASLIPGIESYASMAAGGASGTSATPTTTQGMAATSSAPNNDVVMMDAPVQVQDGVLLDLGGEFNLDFMVDGGGQGGDATDFDSWLEDLNAT
jgi:hypothetical protein